MALQPSQNPLEVVQSNGQDFIQYKNPQGQVLSWIDSNGIGQGAFGGPQTLEVNLSFAQIRALGTTPATGLQIIPNGLPNSFILPVHQVSWFHFGGTVYNAVGINLSYTKDSGTNFVIGITSSISGISIANDIIGMGTCPANSLNASPVILANNLSKINVINGSGLSLYATGATGNGNGTLQVFLQYLTVQF